MASVWLVGFAVSLTFIQVAADSLLATEVAGAMRAVDGALGDALASLLRPGQLSGRR